MREPGTNRTTPDASTSEHPSKEITARAASGAVSACSASAHPRTFPPILNHSCLNPAASPQERHPAFASVADGQQRPLHAAIGAPRDAPQAAKASDASGRTNLLGGDPFKAQFNSQRLGSRLQCERNRLMRRNRLVVVS